MPLKKSRGVHGQVSFSPAAGGDLLGALPDDVLHHVLSFLPAHDAVRTCVLARRWVHLWKSATSLHIVRRDVVGPEAVMAVREFVDHLLLLRGSSPLHTCDLCLSDLNDDDTASTILWIRNILMCKVRVLSINIQRLGNWIDLDGLTLVSDHLKRLQLSNIRFDVELFNFSSCSALEVLEIDECDLSVAESISSQSLKCLNISSKCYLTESSRIHIYTPNLLSLRLEIGLQRTPVLERMPSLVEAFVNLSDANCDCCDHGFYGDCDDDYCLGCYEVAGDINNCVLLQGLSEARNLALISLVEIFIFRRDLKWRPIFSNLKSLLLNEYWCVPADFNALAYMLEHSPVLEKLTLQLFSKGNKSKVEMEGNPDPTGRSAVVSEHLKIVEVKCEVVDDRVLDVLKFLSKLGIHTYRFLF